MSKTIYSDQIKVNCPLICDESGYFHLIYQITNLVNGKIYIGEHSTKDPYDDYMGSGTAINKAIKKYGLENFTKELLFCYNYENDAFLKEAEIVNEEFIKCENTYNIVLGGYLNGGSWCGMNNPFYGKKHTQEVKDIISKKNSGKNNWWYGKHGENNPNFGKKHTEEHKNKISKSVTGEKNPFYGKKHTEETRERMRKNHADFSGENNPNFGRRFSNEIRERMSKAHKGKQIGESNPKARRVIKFDKSEIIIKEYGCIKDCCEQEEITYKVLLRIIKNCDSHNGYYFKCKNNSEN